MAIRVRVVHYITISFSMEMNVCVIEAKQNKIENTLNMNAGSWALHKYWCLFNGIRAPK